MQDKIKFNNIVPKQPDAAPEFTWEDTYTDDSGRDLSGTFHGQFLYRIWSFSFTWTGLTTTELSTILTQIQNPNGFTMHYFNPKTAAWTDDTFYVGRGSLVVRTLEEGHEYYDSIKFNAVRIVGETA